MLKTTHCICMTILDHNENSLTYSGIKFCFFYFILQDLQLHRIIFESTLVAIKLNKTVLKKCKQHLNKEQQHITYLRNRKVMEEKDQLHSPKYKTS